ncbi:hypothetical protein PGAL8A_00000600 [Plasmodium gallinaceum]|uniref:Uncharacterized protein n=1 Tax=Plasmodium gallinaceum TaxID=5849 RepID=A0A1J1GPW8_PLAGA|nr:hypothetical protein PGAL8A_00000600 [Plasmodium gallinaceum]CRG93066.1 hypothetical protein PGAL8A_00000600 [Plasmodium gallinaceum]
MESEENYDPYSLEDDDYIQNSYVTIRLSDQDIYTANYSNLHIPNHSEILIDEENVISNNSPDNQGVYIPNNQRTSYFECFLGHFALYTTLLFLTLRHLFLDCYRGLKRLKRERFDNNNDNSDKKSLIASVINEEEQ